MKAASLFLLAVAAGPAFAAPAEQTASLLRDELKNCVEKSLADQIQRGSTLGKNESVELAFQSCNTEEQVLTGYLYSQNVPATQVIALVAGVKRIIKAGIPEILFMHPR